VEVEVPVGDAVGEVAQGVRRDVDTAGGEPVALQRRERAVVPDDRRSDPPSALVSLQSTGSARYLGASIGRVDRSRDRAQAQHATVWWGCGRGLRGRGRMNIERGDGNPSSATLLRLSDALGIGLSALVDVEQPNVSTLTAAGHAPVLWTGPHGGQASLVAGAQPPDVVELWDWTLPGEQHRSEVHTPGTRELLHVLEGHVDLTVGEHTDQLATGDAATSHGDLPHGYATRLRTL
jgi:hypothetical protein